MRIEKNGRQISNLAAWREIAPPKSANHWVEGRSAYELARAWCGSGTPAMPRDLRALLDSRPETRALVVDCVHPELRVPFDERAGEPRNADLAFIGNGPMGRVAVSIEAKADEPYGETISATIDASLERLITNPRSEEVHRVADLVCALAKPRASSQPSIGSLRYQLLTAVAGSLAYAKRNDAALAVLLVHEFATNKTDEDLQRANEQDLLSFLDRVGASVPSGGICGAFVGPISVPGAPLFDQVPPLLIGKLRSVT